MLLYFLAESIVAPRLAPALQRVLVTTLSQRFSSRATVGTLQVRYEHGLLVHGQDLRITSVLHGVEGDDAKPMLRADSFSFRTGLLSLLLPEPRLSEVQVRGVWLQMPPIAAQGHGGEPGRKVDLDSAVFDDAHVTFASDDPKRAPLVFDFPHGELRNIRPGRPFQFALRVDNGAPIGVTETAGTIGPWNFDDPRNTPVRGEFSFVQKDLNSVPGLHGRLTLHGSYQGTFAQMRAEGTTDDPAFGLAESGHTFDLHTHFAILLDAVASVIHVERVDAALLHSKFSCTGEVTKSRSYPGYDIDLRLNAPEARAEDALALATRVVPPIVRGGLALQGDLGLHAGPATVLRRLQLAPSVFRLTDAAFSSPEVQQRVEDMSERAQGHPHDANAAKASASPAEAQGTLRLVEGVLHFESVRIGVPGAQANAAGQYSLLTTAFHLNGTVHTEASASQMTTGLKSLLSRPFNALFSHGHKGATLPLNIYGSGNQVSFDVVLPGGRQIAAPADHR